MNPIHQYQPSFGSEEANAVERYLKSGGWCTEHRITNDFERAISQLFDLQSTVAVPNGTIALEICANFLKQATSKTRVMVPSYTMIATVNAFLNAGFSVDILDVEYPSLEISTAQIKTLLDKRPLEYAAICYVIPNGRITHECTTALRKFKKEFDLVLICDAAQGIAVNINELNISLPDIFDMVTCSFAPSKLISTGQGGSISTNSKDVADWCRNYKTFGRAIDPRNIIDDYHETFGLNYRFNDLQATIGMEQMSRLASLIDEKKEILAQYSGMRPERGYILTALYPEFCPWFIEFVTDDRDALRERLSSKGIVTRRMYPAMSSQPCLKNHPKVSFSDAPNAEFIEENGLWLPSGYNLTEEQILYVAQTIGQ